MIKEIGLENFVTIAFFEVRERIIISLITNDPLY